MSGAANKSAILSFSGAEASKGASVSAGTGTPAITVRSHGSGGMLGTSSPSQVADEHKLRLRQERHVHDSKPSHLDLAGDGLGRRGQERAIGAGLDPYLIVGDETRLKLAFARRAPGI